MSGPATPDVGALLALALALAWALDAVLGEPRNAWHPVAWFGRLMGPVGQRLVALPPRAAFIGGALAWCAVAVVLGPAGAALQAWALGLQALLAVPLLALALKPCFAWRQLRDEVAAVEAALAESLDAGRARLGRIVSRDVSTLDADEVRESAIETLAENLNDSVVAPLLWFALLGLPGALVYRAANTLDAMWGYRGRWEWAGKWPARADDVLSWLPARVTALLLLPFGFDPMRQLAEEVGRTPSPNGGWPMAAMALRLDVRLRKPGVYALNDLAPSPGPGEVAAAVAVAARTAHAACAFACVALWVAW